MSSSAALLITSIASFNRMTTPDGAQLVVGDVDWLDGLGAQLPELPLPLLGTETHSSSFSSKYSKNNTKCSFPSASGGQNSNHTISLCPAEAYLPSFDEKQSKQFNVREPLLYHMNESCKCQTYSEPESAVEALSMDNSGATLQCFNCNSRVATDLDNSSNENTASHQPHCHDVDNPEESHPLEKLTRPGHLVLAAGVQSEPGRLFTLWWSTDKQSAKCKKE